MSKADRWTTLFSAAGAAGAAVGLIYVVGGMDMSMRYDAFGLTGQQAVAYTSREELLVVGLRSLALWSILGAALVFVVQHLLSQTAEKTLSRSRRLPGAVVLAVVIVTLLLVLHVWWPLAALGAAIVIVTATLRLRDHPLSRFVAIAAAIAAVAVAYESDRISYLVDWTCIQVNDSNARAWPDAYWLGPPAGGSPQTCGVLVGQNDRGFYIGSQGPWRGPRPGAPRYRLLFIPASRVVTAFAQKEPLSAIDARVDDRRKPLRFRLWDIGVR